MTGVLIYGVHLAWLISVVVQFQEIPQGPHLCTRAGAAPNRLLLLVLYFLQGLCMGSSNSCLKEKLARLGRLLVLFSHAHPSPRFFFFLFLESLHKGCIVGPGRHACSSFLFPGAIRWDGVPRLVSRCPWTSRVACVLNTPGQSRPDWCLAGASTPVGRAHAPGQDNTERRKTVTNRTKASAFTWSRHHDTSKQCLP